MVQGARAGGAMGEAVGQAQDNVMRAYGEDYNRPSAQPLQEVQEMDPQNQLNVEYDMEQIDKNFEQNQQHLE